MPINTRSSMRLAAAALLLGLAGIGEAAAHAHLTTATPAAGAVVATAPQELRLKFSEGLELKFTKVAVTGPGKAAVATKGPTLDPGDKALLIVPLPDTLAAGKYTVVWHAVSTDTHKTQGSYSFTVKP